MSADLPRISRNSFVSDADRNSITDLGRHSDVGESASNSASDSSDSPCFMTDSVVHEEQFFTSPAKGRCGKSMAPETNFETSNKFDSLTVEEYSGNHLDSELSCRVFQIGSGGHRTIKPSRSGSKSPEKKKTTERFSGCSCDVD